METILVAVLGMSPGILTETVWALATQGEKPVVVDEVVVITTTEGRERVIQELLTADADHGGQTVWEALKAGLVERGLMQGAERKLKFGPAAIEVFPAAEGGGHLADIRTAADNDLAADFMLARLRGLQGKDNVLIGSVAGGRKTMSTLLYAAFTLIGRPQDRLTHVLVNDPFESPALRPRFYFPRTPPVLHQGRDREGRVVAEARSDEAVLDLADIPFVRVRQFFQRDFSELPGRFMTLVNDLNRLAGAGGRERIRLSFDDAKGTVVMNGTRVDLGPREHMLFAFMVKRAADGEAPWFTKSGASLIRGLHGFMADWLARHPDIQARAHKQKRAWMKKQDMTEISGALGAIRERLKDAGLRAECDLLLPRSRVGWEPAEVQVTPF